LQALSQPSSISSVACRTAERQTEKRGHRDGWTNDRLWLALLRRRGLLSQDRIDLLLSWRRSGFSVHNRVFAHPGDGRDFEALVRYMMRSPISLSRLGFTPGGKQVVYARKGGHDAREPGEDERVDAEDFVARVLVQIPDPRRHLVRDYGACSNRARGQRRKAEDQLHGNGPGEVEEVLPSPPERAALRRRWARLIRRVYEVDPLVCKGPPGGVCRRRPVLKLLFLIELSGCGRAPSGCHFKHRRGKHDHQLPFFRSLLETHRAPVAAVQIALLFRRHFGTQQDAANWRHTRRRAAYCFTASTTQ